MCDLGLGVVAEIEKQKYQNGTEVKKGSIISMFQIIAGTRIKLATHTITTNFGNLRFLFGANGNDSTGYDMAINVTIDAVVV